MKKFEDIRVVNLLQYVRLTGRESTTLGTINNTIFETHIVFSTIPLQIILTSKQGFHARIELQGAEYLIKSKCQSIHSVDLLKLSAIHSILTRHDTENYDILKAIRAYCNFQNKQLLEDFFQHNLPKIFSDFVKIFTNNNFFKIIAVSKSLKDSQLELLPSDAILLLSEFLTPNDIKLSYCLKTSGPELAGQIELNDNTLSN